MCQHVGQQLPPLHTAMEISSAAAPRETAWFRRCSLLSEEIRRQLGLANDRFQGPNPDLAMIGDGNGNGAAWNLLLQHDVAAFLADDLKSVLPEKPAKVCA